MRQLLLAGTSIPETSGLYSQWEAAWARVQASNPARDEDTPEGPSGQEPEEPEPDPDPAETPPEDEPEPEEEPASGCTKGNTCVSTTKELRSDGVTEVTETKTDENGTTTTTTRCYSYDDQGNSVEVPCDSMPDPMEDACETETCLGALRLLSNPYAQYLDRCLADCSGSTVAPEEPLDPYDRLNGPGAIDPLDGGEGAGDFDPATPCVADGCPREDPEGADGPLDGPAGTDPVETP